MNGTDLGDVDGIDWEGLDEEQQWRDAIRLWAEEAGSWHIVIEPSLLANQDPALLVHLRARMFGIQEIVSRMARQPNVSSVSGTELLAAVDASVATRTSRSISAQARRMIVAATINSIWEDISDIHDWNCADYVGKDHVDAAAHRLYHLLEAAQAELGRT